MRLAFDNFAHADVALLERLQLLAEPSAIACRRRSSLLSLVLVTSFLAFTCPIRTSSGLSSLSLFLLLLLLFATLLTAFSRGSLGEFLLLLLLIQLLLVFGRGSGLFVKLLGCGRSGVRVSVRR